MIAPKSIEWRITGVCNERCPYCYGPEKHISAPDETVLAIAKALGSSSAEFVRFTGGEPLLVGNFEDALSLLKNGGQKIILSTNGSVFSKNRSWIDPYIHKLNLSLDGPSKELHALNGRSESGFLKAEKLLQEFKTSPPSYPIKIGTVLTSANATQPDFLYDFYNYLRKYKIDVWKIYQYIPEGPIADANLEVSDRRFQKMKDNFLSLVRDPEFEIVFADVSGRMSAYFIVQPFGEVFIPVRDEATKTVVEKYLGNILTDGYECLVEKWSSYANMKNHYSNIYFIRSV